MIEDSILNEYKKKSRRDRRESVYAFNFSLACLILEFSVSSLFSIVAICLSI